MPITFSSLSNIQYIPTSATAIVVNSENSKTYIKTIWLFNNHTSSVTVDIHKVPNNNGVGTASNANKIASFALQPNETKIFEISGQGLLLTSKDDSLQVKASQANVVTVFVDGGYEGSASGGGGGVQYTYYGFTSCGTIGSHPGVGTTQRFDDSANTHTNRADASARWSPVGYAMSSYGFTSCGSTGPVPGVGTTQRFDDNANTHTNRADATARRYHAGYAIRNTSNAWFGFTSCGYTGSNVGTTQRFDDSANSHTNRADATARHALAGYSMNGYGFTSCGNTGSYVGTTQRFDDSANTHTNRADATARQYSAGYAMPNTSNVWFGYTSCGNVGSYPGVGTTQRFDDTANLHTNRADASVRTYGTGYAMGSYGFTSCGYTGSDPGVGTTQRFDDTANTHTNRADATARRLLAGYTIAI